MANGNLLFYDTETTGIPVWGKPSGGPDQPHIVQLTALLTDADGKKLSALDTLIQPTSAWKIDPEAQDTHGITIAQARSGGVPILVAVRLFYRLWQQADLRVAHGEAFDARMIRIELKRDKQNGGEKAAETYKAGKAFCTQAKSTPIVKAPPTEKMLAAGRNHTKTASLAEAYRHFTGKELKGAHNAMWDVMAVREVYFGILQHQALSDGPVAPSGGGESKPSEDALAALDEE